MRTRNIAALVTGVSFVGGSIAAWMFANPMTPDFEIFLFLIAGSGVGLVLKSVSEDKK